MDQRETKEDQRPIVAQVLAIHHQAQEWTPLTLELISDAYSYAKKMNGRVSCWVHCDKKTSTPPLAALHKHGCDHVFHLINPRFSQLQSESYTYAIARSISKSCKIVFLPQNAFGEEIAALLEERIKALWIPDVLSLSSTRLGAIHITRVLPGGKLSRSIQVASEQTSIVTMKPGVAEIKSIQTPVTKLEIEPLPLSLDAVPQLTQVLAHIPVDPKTIPIEDSEKIVSIGKGAGGQDGVQLASKLADSIDASLAASRVAVDLGWLPAKRQVGQTGKTVKPKLYVACGISGASHHIQGMKDSTHIITINQDDSAPIHKLAHLSLKADLHKLIPEIIAGIVRRCKQKKIVKTQEGQHEP